MAAEIHLYDFDGTLFRSPEPPPGWSGKSWWVHPGSLEPPCVPTNPGPEWWIGSVVSSARKSIADPNVWAVLATGRKDSVFRWRIPELLRLANLNFDEVHLATGETLSFKKNLLVKLVKKLPFVDRVRIWDDRRAHIPHFADLLEQLGVPHEIQVVQAAAMPAVCAVSESAARVASRWMTGRANGVIYIGAFLTPMARQRLLRDFPPTHGVVHADHMTVWYAPPEDAVEALPLGKQVRLKVIGIAEDERGQAVVVRPEGVRVVNRTPHITVSTAQGVPPAYSNDLVGRGWRAVVGPTLTAVLDTHPH